MPIPFGKAFSYGTFLQYLRSPGLNALPCRPTVSREHWLRGLFLLTYCTNEPISARISAILHRLLHGGVAAHAMTHCLTTNTKNDAEYFQGNQHGRPASQRIAKIYRLKINTQAKNQGKGRRYRKKRCNFETEYHLRHSDKITFIQEI